MLHENFGGIEGMTELALLRQAVFVALRENLHLVHFGSHLMVLSLLSADRLT